MSSLMHKPTSPTIDGQTANLRRAATANPAFKPEFRRSLRMHPVLAGSAAAVVLLLLIAIAMRQKPAYYAESLIYIEPFSSKVLADGSSGNFDSTKYESSVAQQMLTAQRADILATALATLPHQVWAVYGNTPQNAASVLQSQLKVGRVGTSYQVSIGLKGPNPENTAAIVNAVTTAYLEAGRKDEISQADQRSQLLSEERGRIEDELAKTRAEQTRLGATLGVANPGAEGGNPFDSQLDALRSQLITARASHDQAAAQLAAISGVNASHSSGLTAAANDVINGDPGLSSMKSTINQRRAQLSSQMAGLTPGNPVYKQDQDELADLDKTLDTMTVQLRDRASRQLQDKLRTDLERSSDVEGRLNSELARQTASATSASPKLQRAAELAADVQRLTARYAIVDNALHSLQLETTGPGMAHLALAASVPAGPEANKKKLILLAALPLALLCGLGAAVFARKRDHRVYTGGDVDDVLGFAPIAMLPARGEVSDEVLEEYSLRLAAGVEGAYRSGNARTFVITPVSSATDIAPLVQALDRKLIDLGLGVAVLQAATVFEQHEQPVELAHADPAYDRHFDGLASTLFARMKADHDVILLESPPLLISAQTEYVARCADVTLLVAESAVTTRGELYQAGVLLQRLNVTGVGSVLEELQLRYADATFVQGVRALEARPRTVSRPRPVVAEAPVPVPEAPAAVVEEPAPLVFAEPVAAAPVPLVEEPHAGGPEAVTEAEEISVEAATPAWYPVHAEVSPEPQEEPAAAEPVPVAVEPLAEVPAQPAAPVNVEEPVPMGLFDSIENERRQSRSLYGSGTSASSANVEPEEAPAPRSWFQRIFQRDAEPVVSILPDNDEDDRYEPAPPVQAQAYDSSRYDLPLPVEEAAAPAPVAAPEPVAAPAPPAPQPVFYAAAPVAQVVEEPLPEPVYTAPEPVVLAYNAPVEGAAAPAPAEPVAIVPAPIVLKPVVLAPVAQLPLAPEPVAAARAYVAAAPVAPAAAEAVPYAFRPQAVAVPVAPVAEPAQPVYAPPVYASQAATVEPVRSAPVRPLSFYELSQSPAPVAQQAPLVQHFEAPVEPEHEYIPAPIAAAELPPVAEMAAPAPAPAIEAARPAPVADDWNPEPLNRWDPIPPLNPQTEPWRSSGSSRIAQKQTTRGVWGEADPVRIPPTDRWVPAQSLPPEAPPAESNDVVLTRRWGLLSRFQQGEAFQSTPSAQAVRPRTPEPEPEQYAQDFGEDFDPEYDRRRR